MVTGPDWSELKAEGCVVLDYPARKLAIYPNTAGQIVLMTVLDGDVAHFDIEPEEVDSVIAALRAVVPQARALSQRIDAQYQTHQALEKARGE